MTLATPVLEHIADLTVRVGVPVEAGDVTGLNSRGRRRIIPITGGTVRMRAAPGSDEWVAGEVLPAGADFQLVVSATSADLDARYMLQLGGSNPAFAGAHLFVMNHAIRTGSAENIARLVRGEPVDPSAIYFRAVPTFEVSAPALAWLSESIVVGTGARHPDRVEMSFFRVG